jgi:Asp-tRNA(Asn)/Glu-tRNA(Gln) amidotransferase A subunit family amidase
VRRGAILIGKTTTSEFGCKPVGDSPLTGVTRNPIDLKLTPGGSSAGCAASVAAGITPFALGADGGGSIRIPAAFTGTFGFKANFGRVPVWPASATPTLAHVCPLARNVRDAALLLQAVAGYDPRDPGAIAGPVPDFLAACDAPVKACASPGARHSATRSPSPKWWKSAPARRGSLRGPVAWSRRWSACSPPIPKICGWLNFTRAPAAPACPRVWA